MPKVTVIIPTYNRAHFICAAIDSVLNQSFRDFEIIVVDNGSTDNTRDLLEKYSDTIQYIHHQESLGRAEARNAGIKIAQGAYLAFLDNDDMWLPHKLEKQVAFLDSHPDIGLVHTFIEIIDEQGRLLQKETEKHFKLYMKALKMGYTYAGMSRLCVMFMSSVMVRRECFAKVGLFDPNVIIEDWDFYLHLSLKYRIGTILEPLVRYRVHETHTKRDEFIQGYIKVSMKHLAILDSSYALALRNRVRHNFYLQLANVYYIDMQLTLFRTYALKALKLNPLILFRSRLGLHFFLSLLPLKSIRAIHRLKGLQSQREHLYPERITPEETFGGPLAAHLKRYDFAQQFCANKIVLDAACGVGYGSFYLSKVAKEVMGIDSSQDAITYAKGHYQKENIQFKVMDVCSLQFPGQYFDMVCSFETLEHLDNPERFIFELKRVLKEDGMLIVSTPYVKETTHNPQNPYHKVEFSRRDFEGLLRKYFRQVEIFGQRRLQSTFHYYLQRLDIFHLRAILPAFLIRKICHAVATHSWDEANLGDFVISKERLIRATELIGVCYLSMERG